MRLPWDRSKTPPQFDLLGAAPSEPVESPDAAHVAGVLPADDADPLLSMDTINRDALQIDALGVDPITIGQPLSVPLSVVYEDPENPRTEFPEAELIELAEDIRQHGILQPIVVHPADSAGRFRIHFGAKRLRAAARAGLAEVPVIVRDAEADPYAQVAENQKRHGLSPLDLARFIRSRVDLGETQAGIAKRLGMDLTTVAHHVALLELPAPLAMALRSGRCSAPRTLYELNKVHAQRPAAVMELLNSERPVTREAVAALRKRPRRVRDPGPTLAKAPAKPASPARLVGRANGLCMQLALVCSQLRDAAPEQIPAEDLEALRTRLGGLKAFLEP